MSEGTFQHQQRGANTGTIALVVAGILLFVVCGMAYKDYIESKMEKEWAEREQRGGYPQQFQGNQNGQYQGQQFQPQQQQQQGYQQQGPQGGGPNNNGNNPVYQPPVPPQTAQNQNQTQQNPTPPAAVPATEPFNVFDAAPDKVVPNTPDPELEKRRRELEQRKQERLIAETKMRQLENGGSFTPSVAPPPSLDTAENVLAGNSVTQIAGGDPGNVVASGSVPFGPDVIGNLGIDPELKEKMGAENYKLLKKEIEDQKAAIERVQNTPAVAQVKHYDSRWNFVELDGGLDRNIRMGQRLTIRRGSKILGVIEITEIEQDWCGGELKSLNKGRDDLMQPQAGDDAIPKDLF